MAKGTDFTIEPDLMKGEIDEHGKQREPFVRLPGEPDQPFILRSATVSATIILGARLGDAWSLLAVGPGRIIARNGQARAPVLFKANQSWNLAEILQ